MAIRRLDSPYLVIPNRTLLDIAIANPKTREELALIKGIGEKKLKTFTRDLLKCIGRG